MRWILTPLLISLVMGAFAQTVYVVPPETPGHLTNAPYNTWTNAATNLVAARTYARNNSITNIVVTNGHYTISSTNERITLDFAVYMRSWNNGAIDPAGTIIASDGSNFPSGRGNSGIFSLSHASAVLDGFTVTNGHLTPDYTFYDDAAAIRHAAGTVRNCILENNYGRIIAVWGVSCLLEDTIIRNNQSGEFGSSAAALELNYTNMIVRRCSIYSNSTYYAVNLTGNNGIEDCVISNNTASFSTVYVKQGSFVKNCDIVGNSGPWDGGGLTLRNEYYTPTLMPTLRNCRIINNTAQRDGGGVDGQRGPICVENCTIASNTAVGQPSPHGGGLYVPDTGAGTNLIINSIIYFNTCAVSPDVQGESYAVWTNACVSFTPTHGTGNTTNDPLFVERTVGNYRLSKGSPCINKGLWRDWMTNAVDLDGYSRVDRFSGLVDMGCYEYIPAGTMLKCY